MNPGSSVVTQAKLGGRQLSVTAHPLWRAGKHFLAAIIGLLAIWLAYRNIHFDQVLGVLAKARYGYIGISLGIFFFQNIIKAKRWRILLGEKAEPLPDSTLLLAVLTGQMLNIVYPARIGDVARAYSVGIRGTGSSFALGTIVLEKLLELVFYAALFFSLFFLLPLPDWINGSVHTFLLVVPFVAAVTLLLAYRPAWVMQQVHRVLAISPGRLRDYLLPRLRAIVSSQSVLRSKPAIVQVLLLSAVLWALAVVNVEVVLRSLGLNLPWSAPMLVLLVLQVGISIPSIPGKLGIFEYSCILALSVFGVGRESALIFGLLLYASAILPVIVFGLISFWILGLNGNALYSKDTLGTVTDY